MKNIIIIWLLAHYTEASVTGCCVGIYATPPPSRPMSITSCPVPMEGTTTFGMCGIDTNCYVLYGVCPLAKRYMSYCYTSMTDMITKATSDSQNTIVWTAVSSASSIRSSLLHIIAILTLMAFDHHPNLPYFLA